jgi:hypothetical protein
MACNVIVRSDRQADDLVDLFGPGSQQDDVNVRLTAQLCQQLDPIHARQHDVQHNQVGFVSPGGLEAGRAI